MVFISHSSKDRQIAHAICHYIEREGIPCWIAPRDISPGELYADAIIRALDKTHHFVLVLSEKAIASRHVLKELERAASRRAIIIPFRIDASRPTGAYEYFISECHWLDAITPPLERHIIQLVTTIKAVNQATSTVATQESDSDRSRVIKDFQMVAPDEWCSRPPNLFKRLFSKIIKEHDY